MLREPLTYKETAEWEDDVLGDELSNQGHRRIIGGIFDVIKHRVDIVEFSDEILKRGRR